MLTRHSPTHVAKLRVRLWRWEPPSSIAGNGNRICQDTWCLLCANGTFSKVDQNLSVSGENWVYLKQDFQTLRVISLWMISRFGKARGAWTNPKVNFIYWCRASVSVRQEMSVCCTRNLCFTGGEKAGDETGKEKGNRAAWLWWISILVGWDSAHFTEKRKKVIYSQDNQEEKTERESGWLNTCRAVRERETEVLAD